MKKTLYLSLLLAGCSPSLEVTAADRSNSSGSCPATFHYRADSENPPIAVYAVGDFNDWQVGMTPLQDTNGNGDYAATLQLEPNDYLYELWVDGERLLDKTNPLTGFQKNRRESSLLQLSDCQRPNWNLTSRTWSDTRGLTVKIQFQPGVTSPGLDSSTLQTHLKHLGGQVHILSTHQEAVTIQVATSEFGRGILEVTAEDLAGQEAKIAIPFWTEAETFRWEDAIIYQVVIDRFRSSTGPLSHDLPASFIHGGDLIGITESIESGYFENLGANVLWLSPVIDNPEGQFIGRDGHLAESYHGYWPNDARRVETRIGGESALRDLVHAAHTRGIRVILDHVLNHIHTDHPYSQHEQAESWLNHPDGSCICGFSCPWSTNIQDCWFDPFLADLNWHNPEVAKTQIDDAIYWLEEYNLDGFRVDAVPMMPRMAIRKLRHELNIKLGHRPNDYYLLGETYTGVFGQNWIRYYLGDHTLSGQFDFPVMWALRSALSSETPMSALADQMHLSTAAYQGSGAIMAPFMGNHDVGRIISALNRDPLFSPREILPESPTTQGPYDLLAMAWTFVMTQPGAPVIYYGDEIGLPGSNDPDNRRPMRFGNELTTPEAEIFAHVKRMSALRLQLPALREGRLNILHADTETIVYTRESSDHGTVLVGLNRSVDPKELQLEWTPSVSSPLVAVFGAELEQFENHVSLTLSGRSLQFTLLAEDQRDEP